MKPLDRPLQPSRQSRQAPPYHAAQSMNDLGFCEQFTVWAVRTQWPHGEAAEETRLIDDAFAALDLPEGCHLVADFTKALRQTISRPLGIPDPTTPRLTDDEAQMLRFLAGLQGLARCEGSPCLASPAWRPALRLVIALNAAGLHFGGRWYESASFPEALPQLH
ncbi:hypothetical protein FHS78_002144 [Parvibaculum indicum]|uniref:hypothetical protein n=1 Tax=Parvibaculum indicum TaxID=562969 RepID=UPI0014225B81|nr:hypothetical protein [Parvibaculum indicum]NIJ41854.1 hypothetical protein [Parvibaculum indicum]